MGIEGFAITRGRRHHEHAGRGGPGLNRQDPHQGAEHGGAGETSTTIWFHGSRAVEWAASPAWTSTANACGGRTAPHSVISPVVDHHFISREGVYAAGLIPEDDSVSRVLENLSLEGDAADGNSKASPGMQQPRADFGRTTRNTR